MNKSPLIDPLSERLIPTLKISPSKSSTITPTAFSHRNNVVKGRICAVNDGNKLPWCQRSEICSRILLDELPRE